MSAETQNSPAPSGEHAPVGPAPSLSIVDLSSIDLHGVAADKESIHRYISHRGTMSLLDRVVWKDLEALQGVAVVDPNPDAFWVAGHFPERAIMPGVLQVEAGAQLCAFLFNARVGYPRTAAFIRLEECVFRNTVDPSDRLFIIVNGVKFSDKRFIARAQGLLEPGGTGERVAYEAKITGIAL